MDASRGVGREEMEGRREEKSEEVHSSPQMESAKDSVLEVSSDHRVGGGDGWEGLYVKKERISRVKLPFLSTSVDSSDHNHNHNDDDSTLR